MARRPSRQSLSTGILIVLMAGVLVSQALQATAHHEPAQKAAASAAKIAEVGNKDTVLLQETMRVSSTEDLILNANLECTILTSLITNNDDNSATAQGRIDVWITIDGRVVPVTTADIDASKPGVQTDDGMITFCDRTYSRTVTDQEDNTPPDGIDQESDYIRTKSSHSWQWLAIDVGKNYDAALTGQSNNIVNLVLHAKYTESGQLDDSTGEAFAGSRMMIADVTHVSNHEQVIPTDENATTTCGLPTCP